MENVKEGSILIFNNIGGSINPKNIPLGIPLIVEQVVEREKGKAKNAIIKDFLNDDCVYTVRIEDNSPFNYCDYSEFFTVVKPVEKTPTTVEQGMTVIFNYTGGNIGEPTIPLYTPLEIISLSNEFNSPGDCNASLIDKDGTEYKARLSTVSKYSDCNYKKYFELYNFDILKQNQKQKKNEGIKTKTSKTSNNLDKKPSGKRGNSIKIRSERSRNQCERGSFTSGEHITQTFESRKNRRATITRLSI